MWSHYIILENKTYLLNISLIMWIGISIWLLFFVVHLSMSCLGKTNYADIKMTSALIAQIKTTLSIFNEGIAPRPFCPEGTTLFLTYQL